MKKYGLFIGFLILLNCSKENTLTNFDATTPQILSVETFGGSKNDVLASIIKTSDGGYATLGYTQSNDGDIFTKTDENFDFWLLKFSKDNTLIWNKTFGNANDDRGTALIETQDGGFALLGYSRDSGSQDFLLIKLTSDGTLAWQKSYGFAGADYGTKVIQTSDNGFLVIGALDVTGSNGQGKAKTLSAKHAGGDFWALKLDAIGNLEWSNYFGGSFTDTPLGIVETADSHFIIIGSSDSNDVDISNNKGSYDFWVIKITSAGSLLWEKSFGGSEIDEGRAIVATNDGNFMIVGDTRSSDKDITKNNGAADIWILKISPEGTIVWEKTLGGTSFDVPRSITKTTDNSFLIAGSSRSTDNGFTNKGQNDGLLIKIDGTGNLIWQKTVGGSEIDFFYDAIEIRNNTFIAVGESNSNNQDIPENKGFTDVLLVKIKQ